MDALITLSALAKLIEDKDPETAVTKRTLVRWCKEAGGMRCVTDIGGTRLTTREWYEEYVMRRGVKAEAIK